jgi:malate dehydrogenase
MDRKDLLKANAAIFEGQGKALDQWASRQVKVLVVGNPANTNALITRHYAPSLPASAFTAMTRLDQNRAQAQVAKKLGVSVASVKNIVVWGNHSNTQYPDVTHAHVVTAQGTQTVTAAVGGSEWLQGDFIKVVQSRGAAIIEALKKSSAASAANAAVEHVRDWVLGTKEGEWVSMGIISDGNGYGVEGNLCFSFPVQCKGGEWKIVDGLDVDAFSRSKLQATQEELIQERRDALGGQ